MIERYKDEMISQPNYKWHANEAQRPFKLAHAARLNDVNNRWWRNFFIGAILTGPLFVFPFARSFMRYNSGVPFWNRPKFVFAAKE